MVIKKKKIGVFAVVLLIFAFVISSALTFLVLNNTADAIKTENMSSQSTDLGKLLFDGYENGGKIFNAEVFWNLISRVSGGSVSSTNQSGLSSLGSTAKSSADFRSHNASLGNGAKDIVVTIAGKQWIATYLSQNTAGEPILTLWLANSTTKSTWCVGNNNYQDAWANQFTTNLYGTSYIRAVTLNNGGEYAATTSSMPTRAQIVDSEWAIYTVPNTTSGMKGSLTEYIEIPNNMSWQHEQKSLDYVNSDAYIAGDGKRYNCNNDALDYGSVDSVGSTGNYKTRLDSSLQSYYSAWGKDTLWLPSVTETGVSGEEGIWKASNYTRANGESTWLRSARYNNYIRLCALTNGGASLVAAESNASTTVRPAFHLNLAKVAQSLSIPAKPVIKGENLKYQTGSSVAFELDKINKDFVDIEFTVEYLDSDYTNVESAVNYSCTPNYANGVMSFNVQNVGRYTVKVTPKQGQYWKDGTSTTETYTYSLKYKVIEPKFTGNSTSAEGTYNGDEQSFSILNYDENKMSIKADEVDDLTFETSPSAVFKVKNAKTSYVVQVELKNKTLMEWSTAGDVSNKSLTVTMKKKQVAKPTLATSESASKQYTGDPINFTLTGMSADVELKDPSSAVVTTITQTNVGTYDYTLALKDKNNTEWVDGGTADDTVTVYITSSGVDKPSLSNSTELLTQEKVYSTTTTPKGATFTVYNTTGATITAADSSQTDATISGNTITVTKVGTYTFTVSLADTTNTQWKDGTNGTFDLIVKVKAKEVVKPTLNDNPPSKEYTGSPITFGVTGLNADIELKDPSSAVVTAITQTNVGTYDYTATLADPINTVWAGGGTATVHLPVTIARKNIEIPKFGDGADRKTYNGSNQSFTLVYNTTAIEVKNEENSVVTSFTEKNAKTYTYTLSLKDKVNTQWAGTDEDTDDKEIKFYIDKKVLNITSFTCSESENATPSWEKGKEGVTFTVVEDSLAGDTVKLKLYREQSGVKTYDMTSVDESIAKTVTVTMPDYLPQGSYILGVELADADSDNANDNYTLSTTNTSQYRKTFIVKGQGLILTEENMPWVYKYTDGDSGLTQEVSISAQVGETVRSVKLTYTGYEYEFTVNEEELLILGAVIDTSKGSNGFSGDTKWTNAMTSETTITVYWKTAEGYESASGSFQLKYFIEKAKYNLTPAKWNYTNPQEYDPLLFRAVQIVDLPDGLTIGAADYSDNRYKPAGKYTAKVKSIQNSNVNYYTPSTTDKNTYIYNNSETDGEFPWSLNWEIAPKKLTLTWVEKTSDNGDFVYYVVSGDEVERIDGYLYYKDADYDNTTGEASGSALALDDIKVVSKQVDAYWVVAVLQDPNNYVIENNKARRFTVGSLKELVKVALKDSQPFIYNGNQYGKDITVSSDENTLTTANIIKKYYKDSIDDANLISDAPINAGKYILVLSLQDGLEEDYELVTKHIEFEIEKVKIIATWDTTGNIPKLANEQNYPDIIGYEYFDADGNIIADVEALEAGNTYKVKAILKDNYGDNYEFVAEDGETVLENPTATDEQEFTIEKEPEENENPEKGGNAFVDFFKNLIEKHFPLWQIGTMAVAGILTLIFLIKAIQYGNRKKRVKGSTKKTAKAYAALLPIFSTEPVLFGLSNQIWTIMAFAMVGLAVFMLLIALIMRGGWKRALRAKEEAVNDGGQQNTGRSSAIDSQVSNELNELRTQLALITSQQGVGGSSRGGSSDSAAIIEAMRHEMEERRREEEARRREDEERHRKEMDAMKMIFAGLMGNRQQQGDDDMIYGTIDDTDMLVQRVIAGLLPTVQQMMPEAATAYLNAPQAQNEELLNIVEEQNAQMQAMSEQMKELQAQLDAVHGIADAIIMPESNDELIAQMDALKQQVANLGAQSATDIYNQDLIAEMNAMRQKIAMLEQGQYVYDDIDDDLDDDEEEWDSILDEDEDDNFVESVIIEADGTVRKVSPNFRMRLKESSEQNREWYAAIKNLFCSQKGVTYRVCKRVEKIRYQGQIIGVIGIAKRSIKLWLALKPYEYDARRYHHKDVSDKPRFVDVPLYVRVGSDRALTRAQELILALFQDFNMEARKRYNDRDIQELIFTLKHNKLLTNKQYKRALCQIIHVHDCNVLDDETAQKCIEFKNVDFIDDSVIETVKLDDIDAHFQDGNRITLEKLRKVGLVSAECTGYTVTADKRLTKPLIVVANDFTLPAVKMIALTGGRVIKLSQV